MATSLYGDDGGTVCAAAADGQSGLARSNVLAGSAYRGSSHPEVKRKTIRYTAAVIAVYCPDELPAFRRYVAGLNVDEAA